MKLKYVCLLLFTALVINHANGLESTDNPSDPVPKGTAKRSALTSSAMTQDEDDLSENVSTANHTPLTVPPLKASAPIKVPVPKIGSPKGSVSQSQLPAPTGAGSPKNRIRYNHNSMATDVVPPNPGKPADQ